MSGAAAGGAGSAKGPGGADFPGAGGQGRTARPAPAGVVQPDSILGEPTIDGLIREWEGHGVVTRFDRETGTWIFIALHDLTMGPAMGGTRMTTYPTPAHGLRDAMRLARGMTEKWAVIEFPFGGGKTVLAVPGRLEGDERDGLLRRFGRLIESLGGLYGTGPDLGTTPEDLSIIGQETAYAHGKVGGSEVVDPGPYTALGVFVGMREALKRMDRDLEGARVLIQGVGDVGAPLARLVAEAGGVPLLSDVDAAKVDAVRREVGGEVVAAEAAYRTACDVFAPCAIGATVNRETAPALECVVVAGSANNQLDAPQTADTLHRRGILYVPDYVGNAGGATALPMLDKGYDDAAVRARVERIGPVVAAILEEAAERDESPLHAAARRVRRNLEAKRRGDLAPTIGPG